MNDAERRQRLCGALLCGGIGLYIGYIAWSRQPGLRVPPPVAYLAPAAFLAAGAGLLLQTGRAKRAAEIPALVIVLAFAGIGGWIALGSGNRRCDAVFAPVPIVPGELACRAAFGAGAVLTGLMAGIIFRSMLRSLRHPSGRGE